MRMLQSLKAINDFGAKLKAINDYGERAKGLDAVLIFQKVEKMASLPQRFGKALNAIALALADD